MGDKYADVAFWDTCGQERFKSISSAFYRGSAGVIVCYDITDRESFDDVANWIAGVESNNSDKSMKLILVGTKADQADRRAVSFEEGQQLAN